MTTAAAAAPVDAVLVVAGGVRTGGPGASAFTSRPGAGGAVGASPPPRAVLIVDGWVRWVGSDPAAAPRPDGRAVRVVDLGGAWVTPAFVDAHVHGTATGLVTAGVDLAGAVSLGHALDRLRGHVRGCDDAVIMGAGWDDTGWPEARTPTALEVAAAAPGRTVLLDRVDVHSCVVDPETLAGLPLHDLHGVDRDAHGTATGWLREEAAEAARRLVRARLTAGQLAAARGAFATRAAGLGIASVHEMGHPGLGGLDDALAWRDGRWPVEVHTWWADLDVDAVLRHGLRPGGDLFLDGSIGSRTAAASCGYRDGAADPQLFHADDVVERFFATATLARVGAGVHAIGDVAIAQAVSALEAAAATYGVDAVRACRHRVEHLELADRDQLRRLGRLGVIASLQPVFDALWGGPDRLYAARFGAAVAVRTNPLDWIVAAGMPLAFGSDTTVTPLDPWGGVVAAERHRGGRAIDRASAFAAATVGGRRAGGQDDVGTVVAGARADLAVWPVDPFAVRDPRGQPCLATFLAGEITHGDVEGVPRRGEPAVPRR